MKKYLLSLLSLFVLSPLFAQNFPDNTMLNNLQQYSNQKIECSDFACNSVNSVSFDTNSQDITASFNVSARQSSFITLPFSPEEVKIYYFLLDNKPWYKVVLQDSSYKVVIPSGEHTLTVRLKAVNNSLALTQKIQNTFVSKNLVLEERNGSYLISVLNKNTQLVSQQSNLEQSSYVTTPFYQVSRNLILNNSWKVITTVTPLFNTTQNTVLTIPLLKGEKILNSDIQIDNNNAIVSVSSQSVSWESSLPQTQVLEILPTQNLYYHQLFSIQSSHLWQYSVTGKNPFDISGDSTSWSLWSGEQLLLNFKAPTVLPGKTLSLSNLNVQFNKSHDTYYYQYSFNATTSLAGKTYFTIPDNYKIESLLINNTSVNIDKNTKKIPVDLSFGNNTVGFSISTDTEQFLFKQFPHIVFPEKVYNSSYSLTSSDWIIYSGGADINTEYILFSSFIVLIILTYITKKITPTLPIFVIAFVLFGFLQNSLLVMSLLPILLLLIKGKSFVIERFEKNHISSQYNFYQFLLILTSLVFLISFLVTLKLGLLDSPSSWTLYDNKTITWFNEIYSSNPVWYIEIESSIYHIIMFVWAIFVSYHLINIAKMAFTSIFHFELWIKKTLSQPISQDFNHTPTVELLNTSEDNISTLDNTNDNNQTDSDNNINGDSINNKENQ